MQRAQNRAEALAYLRDKMSRLAIVAIKFEEAGAPALACLVARQAVLCARQYEALVTGSTRPEEN
jgi:hypothetical protein